MDRFNGYTSHRDSFIKNDSDKNVHQFLNCHSYSHPQHVVSLLTSTTKQKLDNHFKPQKRKNYEINFSPNRRCKRAVEKGEQMLLDRTFSYLRVVGTFCRHCTLQAALPRRDVPAACRRVSLFVMLCAKGSSKIRKQDD